MKKLLIIFAIVLITILLKRTEDQVIIPTSSIRIRIIANSNSKKDQQVKNIIKEKINNSLSQEFINTKDLASASTIVNNNLSTIENLIKETYQEENYQSTYQVNYGENYFPTKEFSGVIYQEGYYNSLVITLGAGLGDNWWCVLFPPLCLLEKEEENVNYRLFVVDVLKKYFE